jgi:hypothetical protein
MLDQLPLAAGLLLTGGILAGASSWAAEARNPLDPSAAAGVVTTVPAFDGHIPLLDREAPAPSFAGATEEPSVGDDQGPAAQVPADHDGMNHTPGGHGAVHAPTE